MLAMILEAVIPAGDVFTFQRQLEKFTEKAGLPAVDRETTTSLSTLPFAPQKMQLVKAALSGAVDALLLASTI
jgi:hypothetical protein